MSPCHVQKKIVLEVFMAMVWSSTRGKMPKNVVIIVNIPRKVIYPLKVSSLCVKFHEAVIIQEDTGGNFIQRQIQHWLGSTASRKKHFRLGENNIFILHAENCCLKLNVNIIKWVCM